MEVLREVHCRVMKGCGPDWVDKNVTVFLDDVDPTLCQSEIDYMVRYDVKQQLKSAGFVQFTIVDIHNA